MSNNPFLTHGRRAGFVLAGLLGLVVTGCDVVKSIGSGGGRDREVLTEWLLCESCTNGEVDSIKDRGDRMVPLLAEALKGPPERRVENMRDQLRETHERLARRAASQGRTLPLSSNQYVTHFMSNYRAQYQARAAAGLAAIGTPLAKNELENAFERVKDGALVVRGDVRAQLDSLVNTSTTQPSVAWRSITAGLRRSCGIRTDGQSYCWGQNDQGQLGDGTTEGRRKPTAIAGNLRFTSIAAGATGWHTCGIATDSAYCWGSNVRGELGDGSLTNRRVPTKVAGTTAFAAVSPGGNHTCARSLAYEAYCWGGNNFGQLGDNTSVDKPDPTRVGTSLNVRSMAAGTFHTCADSVGGLLYCWGANGDGQLGDGSAAPHDVPAQVSSAVRFSSISLGAFHGCALTRGGPGSPSGIAYCVGRNDSGQLGDGSLTARSSLVKVEGGYRFAAISAGSRHTCGITAGTGVLRCWGFNAGGQLGDGSVSNRNLPVKVAGQLKFVTVSAGNDHTCAITAQGVAYCWGRNASGQLGDGSLAPHSVPMPVVFP